MKYLITLILLLIMAFVTACNFNKKQIDGPGTDQSWQALTITDDHRIVITIKNDNDSSTVKIYHTGSIFTPRPSKIIVDTLKVWFTKSEKDTLAYLTKDIILHPVGKTGFCTEFVGSIAMKIYYGQFKLSGEYNSVCDWTLLSDQTKQLNNILQRQMKKLKTEKD